MQPPQKQQPVFQLVSTFSEQLLNLAEHLWNTLQESSDVTQEIAKDPFTSDAKKQAVTAELLIFLLHICDRVSTAAFLTALPPQTAEVLRNAFMNGTVGVTLPAFVRKACPEDDQDELEETQADLLHLYNTRATQYGCFSFGGAHAAENNSLFTLAAIRLTEALECPDNPEVISHGVEVIVSGLATLREKLPLKETIGELLAGAR
jgi:hypothetical protein